MTSRTRPGRGVMTMMRSASSTASGMEWVMNSTVFGRSDQMRSKLEAHLVARQRVERRERLVHQQNIRIEQQGPRNRDALLHAAGQFVDALAGKIRQADQGQQFARARLCPRR